MKTSPYSITKASTDRVMLREIAVAKAAPGARMRDPMTPAEARELRGEFTQAQWAAILGYKSAMRVSEFERPTNPLPIPLHVAFVMRVVAGNPGYFWQPGAEEHDPFA